MCDPLGPHGIGVVGAAHARQDVETPAGELTGSGCADAGRRPGHHDQLIGANISPG